MQRKTTILLLVFSSFVFITKAQGVAEKLVYTIDYASAFPAGNTTVNAPVSIPLDKEFYLAMNLPAAAAPTVSVSYMPENNSPGVVVSANANGQYGPFSLKNLTVIGFTIKFTSGGTDKTLSLKFVKEQSEGDTTLKTPNFLVISFIKSIAGSEIRDELLDLFVKVNYGKNKRTFSMFGADAGINASPSDSANSLLRLNEAIANINFTIIRNKYARYKRDSAVYKVNSAKYPTITDRDLLIDTGKTNWTDREKKRYKRYLDSTDNIDMLKRVAFFGGGLKVFYSNPYFGGHIGIIEVNSKLMGSYFFMGYYYSPYVTHVDSTQNGSIASKTPRNYRHNLYFEAGFNAFGDGVPLVLKSIRFKFGLMLPFAYTRNGKGDSNKPLSSDVLYRLAVEVPIGGAFRF